MSSPSIKQMPFYPLGHLVTFDPDDHIFINTVEILHDGQPVTAELYQYVYTSPNDSVYKLVVDRQTVLGYRWLTLEKSRNVLVGAMAATFDFQYQQVGTRLSQLVMEKLWASEADALEIIASWNSHGYHFKNGFRLLQSPAPVNGHTMDQRIKTAIQKAKRLKKSADTDQFEWILMALPRWARLKHLFAAPRILLGQATEAHAINGQTRVGQTTLKTRQKVKEPIDVRAYQDAHGLWTYTLHARQLDQAVVGKITLNPISRDADGQLMDRYSCYPDWSPLSWYGRAKKSHLHIEHWQWDTHWRYDSDEIQKRLFKVAVEASLQLGFLGRTRIEIDWGAHAIAYQFGFRSQDYCLQMTVEEIHRYIADELEAAKAQHRSPMTKPLGSLKMLLPRQNIPERWHEAMVTRPLLVQSGVSVTPS